MPTTDEPVEVAQDISQHRSEIETLCADLPDYLVTKAAELIARYQITPHEMSIKVVRTYQDGGQSDVGRFPLATYSVRAIAEAAGEGDYLLELRCNHRRASGNRGQTRIRIDPGFVKLMRSDDRPNSVQAAAPAAPAIAQAMPMVEELRGMMAEIRKENMELVKLVIGSRSEPAAAKSLVDQFGDMAKMMALVKGLMPTPTPLGEMASAIQTFRTLAEEQGLAPRGESPGSSDGGFIEMVKPLVATAIQEFMKHGQKPAAGPAAELPRHQPTVPAATKPQPATATGADNRRDASGDRGNGGSGGAVATDRGATVAQPGPGTSRTQEEAKAAQTIEEPAAGATAGVHATEPATGSDLSPDVIAPFAQLVLIGAMQDSSPDIYAAVIADAIDVAGGDMKRTVLAAGTNDLQNRFFGSNPMLSAHGEYLGEVIAELWKMLEAPVEDGPLLFRNDTISVSDDDDNDDEGDGADVDERDQT